MQTKRLLNNIGLADGNRLTKTGQQIAIALYNNEHSCQEKIKTKENRRLPANIKRIVPLDAVEIYLQERDQYHLQGELYEAYTNLSLAQYRSLLKAAYRGLFMNDFSLSKKTDKRLIESLKKQMVLDGQGLSKQGRELAKILYDWGDGGLSINNLPPEARRVVKNHNLNLLTWQEAYEF